MRNLTILMVTGFPCIRALKEAQALTSRGHRILLLCSRRSNNRAWDTTAEGIYLYRSVQELVLMLKVLAPKADIVHCHNEPNWHILVTRKMVKNIPVIYDCHDFTSLYRTVDDAEREEERVCFEECDAVIHVSGELLRRAGEIYKQKKAIILYSLPSVKNMDYRPKFHLSGYHVAYEGGISDNPDEELNFRYYLPYFHRLSQDGIHVHAYPSEVSRKSIQKSYGGNKFIHLYPTLEYKTLLSSLSSSTWGFTGFYRKPDESGEKAFYLDNAMPNKLFEYLYVGLTPIVINCKEAARFVTEHNVGYAVATMDEFSDVVRSAPPLAKNIDLRLIDMDVQIQKLEDLYRELLG